jgi:S1-C subfamily serine protease
VFRCSQIARLTAFLIALCVTAGPIWGDEADSPDQKTRQNPTTALGFTGHFEPQQGMVVDRVHYGAPAWRLGLERGDAVQSINGERIRSPKHYAELLSDSPYRVRLTIVAVRTGRPASRSVFLRAPYEPEEVEAFANR